MQVVFSNIYSNKKQPSFQRRSPEIRFADEIMRRTNRCFPRISDTKIVDELSALFEIEKLPKHYLDYVERKIRANYILRAFRPDWIEEPSGFVQKVIEDVREYKIGDCGESSTLGKVALALNGIKSVKAGLCVYKKGKIVKHLNHGLNVANLGEKATLYDVNTFGKHSYVADFWNEFVDYTPNAFERFREKFEKHLRIGKDGVPKSIGICLSSDFEINEKTLDTIQASYPELKIR